MKTPLIPFLILLPIAFLHGSASTGDQDLQPLRAAIAQNYRDWIDATKRKDVDTVLALYADDAIVLPPGAAPVTGRNAIREFYKQYYADPSQLLDEQFTNTSLVVRGDLAIDTAEYSGEIDRGKNLVVWKRHKDGSWRLFRDMWSSSAGP
jgi:uncharacterized protein (TIGR02246 family)